ncbi:MAG: RbsD/FucU domain-containing protein [Candidatus Sulfotelmatobacter sp.]
MNTIKSGLRVAISVVALLTSFSSFSFAQTPATTPAAAPASDWKAIVQNRLSLYGHRNWIVVADSAFPAYASPGIETIAVNEDLPSVLKYVAHAISSSRHVRATVFVDQELQFIDEHDYPGVTQFRRQIAAEFAKQQVTADMPHADIMNKVDEAGKTFRILFLKTTATIPYTSVFMRLDCGYLSDDVERKIRTAMAAADSQPPK